MRALRKVLALQFITHFISYTVGLFFGDKSEFEGELKPLDVDVCTTQDVTYTSVLLQSPELNYSIGFAIKNRETHSKYVAVDQELVTNVNETMSQFTVYNITFESEDFSEPVYFYVKSYYWKELGVRDANTQLGDTSAVRVYPLLEQVQDFDCIVNNYKSMRCTWNYGKDYGENMPEVIFQWRLSTFSASWNDCKDLNIEKGYCNWNSTRDGYFKNTNITISITLQHKCNINNIKQYHVHTGEIGSLVFL